MCRNNLVWAIDMGVQAGKLLARRLFGGSSAQMDYTNVATTVFSPLEYGCVGLSEEEATEKYGTDGLEVYHSVFKPLEWTVPLRGDNSHFCKIICVKAENDRVVGMHIVGVNAGEVIQGFTLGVKLGATKADIDNLVGIHPTVAEEFTTLSVTKSSGMDPMKGELYLVVEEIGKW